MLAWESLMDKEKFTGAWRLVSTEYQSEEGEVTYPFGREVIGLLMYDGKQNMSVQIINAERPYFASNDWLRGTPEEFPNWMKGVDHVRYYEFSGSRLILRTGQLLMGGKKVIGRLVWEQL
jgi:hypothetical protein